MSKTTLHKLYTVGYGERGMSPGALLAAAVKQNAVIVDTRMSPKAMNPVWRKYALERELGPFYKHLPAFGNTAYKTGGIVIADFDSGCAEVHELLKVGPVVLMCACKYVHECHRKVVAEKIVAALECDLAHIGIRELISMAGNTPPPSQPTLF
jgi:uncharacterized protein (DUF488 family)